MAQKTVVTITDDIDGSEGASTVAFGLDGLSFEIDLSKANEKKLREALEPFVARARKIKPAGNERRRAAASNASGYSKSELRDIRAWAKANNHSVSERGRIAANIVEAYRAALRAARGAVSDKEANQLWELIEFDASELTAEQWGLLAPHAGDDGPWAMEKLRVWCRVTGKTSGNVKSVVRYMHDYKSFYANPANWSIPQDSDLPGPEVRDQAKALRQDATVLEFKSA